MKIHSLTIEGFKSIGSITLVEPNPFTVFVGPNASGKSNIFEALEFMEMCNIMSGFEVAKLFGTADDILNQKLPKNLDRSLKFKVNLGTVQPFYRLLYSDSTPNTINASEFGVANNNPSYFPFLADINFQVFTNFTRLFPNESSSKVKRKLQDDSRLSSDASNLEKVLKRILKDDSKREEIIETLELLIPGFSNVEIKTEELSGSDNLLIYENDLERPLTKRLISDGTYNMLAIMAALYQSNEPQFLCIEEPENGLNPKVIKLLVDLFRDKCAEEGHYIWINTHSQSLVAELTPEEIILVDKKNGLTQIKQIKDKNLHGLKMDEALMTNVLGGGIPW